MRGAPRAYNSNGVMIALLQFAPNVEHDWRRMDFAQWPRIRRRIPGDDGRTKIAHPFEFRAKIDTRFPSGNLICNFVADSLDLAKLAPCCGKDLLGFLKHLQQFPEPHRPNGRQHVERDARFSRVHSKSEQGVRLTPIAFERFPEPALPFKTGSRPRPARLVLLVWVVRWSVGCLQ